MDKKPQKNLGQEALANWQQSIQQNTYTTDIDFTHSIQYYLSDSFHEIHSALLALGEQIPSLESLVDQNHLPTNLPRIDYFSAIGDRIDQIVHHPSYTQVGDMIYGSQLLSKIAKPGGLLEGLSLFFLTSQVGEAGHNCPIACSAGMIRVLNKVGDFPHKQFYLEKLISPSFQSNYTGAQFLTEIQGGSDVGANTTVAKQDKPHAWRIYGEKWFCSNADAELIFITARFDPMTVGTKGLGLFLVPAEWNHTRNNYTLRRLKEKLGTRTLATAEIDFHGSFAYAMGEPEHGFQLVMENVLHVSRLFNTFCVLGMVRRAYTIALSYSKNRVAFSHAIIDYPLVGQTLAKIKAENAALLAGIYFTTSLQDQVDSNHEKNPATKLLLRLLVNVQKYLSAKWSVDHIRLALSLLAGNGIIETFSALPRLLRDSLVCETWEGTHNVLQMQVLKDMQKYEVDKIYIDYMQKTLRDIRSHSDSLMADFSQKLLEQLNELEKQILHFRQEDAEVQTLQISSVVDRMTILFCATHLLKEGLDQAKSKIYSKLNCFKAFYRLQVEKAALHSKDDLLLIKAILSL